MKTALPGQGSTSGEQVSTTRWTWDRQESSGQVVEAWSYGSGPLGGEEERERERIGRSILKFTPDKKTRMQHI